MNIIIETERTKTGPSFMLIEDDGSEDGGRIVARLYRHDEALTEIFKSRTVAVALTS